MSSTVRGSSARAVGLIWITHSSSGAASSSSCTGGFWENRPSQNVPPSVWTAGKTLGIAADARIMSGVIASW